MCPGQVGHEQLLQEHRDPLDHQAVAKNDEAGLDRRSFQGYEPQQIEFVIPDTIGTHQYDTIDRHDDETNGYEMAGATSTVAGFFIETTDGKQEKKYPDQNPVFK
jgi:hypothetical protein